MESLEFSLEKLVSKNWGESLIQCITGRKVQKRQNQLKPGTWVEPMGEAGLRGQRSIGVRAKELSGNIEQQFKIIVIHEEDNNPIVNLKLDNILIQT